MSEPWSDDRVSPLIDKLKTLEERRRNAETARGEAEARIAKIKSTTRLKDRHLWLQLWANGDRSVLDEYRPLRAEAKHHKQQTVHIPQACQTVVGKLEKVIADDLERNNSDYRGIVTEQGRLRRKSDVCRDALAIVVRTRGNITSVSASLHVQPKGRAAAADAKRKPGEISAQLKVVREKVDEVDKIVDSRGRMSGTLVKKLNMTLLGTEFGPDERKKQLNDAVGTLDEVAHKIEASRGKFEKRLRELEKRRADVVKAERDRLLSMHGLTGT